MNALLLDSGGGSGSPAISSPIQPEREQAVSGTQRYGFKIGSIGLLFPENCLGEVVTTPDICVIPHTQDWMRGVMTLRGHLIPVVDLQALLFGEPIDSYKPTVLVLDQGKQAFGFLLRESPLWLTELAEVPLSSVTMPDVISAQISRAYQQQSMVWLSFNAKDFFSFLAESAKSC